MQATTEEELEMAQRNGGGEVSSLDGFSGSATDDPFAARPELLLGAVFLGGLLLAGLVSRVGR